MHPGKNNYPVEQQVSNEVAIRSDWLTGEDLFLITEQVNPNGTIDFKAIINPLVNLIWLAGLVFLLGSVVTLWPDAREERRLAVRYGRLRAGGLVVLTAALVLGALLAVAAVVVRRPAVPARRRPRSRSWSRRPRAARARGGARPRARGAEGARVRPPHGEGLGRRLPQPGRRAQPRGRAMLYERSMRDSADGRCPRSRHCSS